jgi:hypothetical protein
MQAAREHMLAEDLEALDIERQMQLDQLEEFKEVERVIEQSDDDQELSFLCKWRHLPYDEATWEQAGRHSAGRRRRRSTHFCSDSSSR